METRERTELNGKNIQMEEKKAWTKAKVILNRREQNRTQVAKLKSLSVTKSQWL